MSIFAPQRRHCSRLLAAFHTSFSRLKDSFLCLLETNFKNFVTKTNHRPKAQPRTRVLQLLDALKSGVLKGGSKINFINNPQLHVGKINQYLR
jgi:hypothetical protein